MTGMSDFDGVAVSDAFDDTDEVRVGIGTEWCWLRRADVRALRDHLTALLGDRPGTPAPAIEIGREYRLLSDVAQAAREAADDARADAHYMVARWFRRFADKIEGKAG